MVKLRNNGINNSINDNKCYVNVQFKKKRKTPTENATLNTGRILFTICLNITNVKYNVLV